MKGVLFSLLKEVARKHQKPLTVGIKEQKLFHCLPLKDPEGLNNRGNLYTDDSLQRSKHFKLQKLFIYIFMTVCKAIAFLDGLSVDETNIRAIYIRKNKTRLIFPRINGPINALVQSIELSLHSIYKNPFLIKQYQFQKNIGLNFYATWFKKTTSCCATVILGDPGADGGGKGKPKRVEKYGTKKSKERREEPLGTMSYQTSSKRSPPF